MLDTYLDQSIKQASKQASNFVSVTCDMKYMSQLHINLHKNDKFTYNSHPAPSSLQVTMKQQ